jgi:hypothetical protein
VSLKERQFVRHVKLQVSEQVLELYRKAIVETEAFMEYLDRFPKTDRAEVHESLQMLKKVTQSLKLFCRYSHLWNVVGTLDLGGKLHRKIYSNV